MRFEIALLLLGMAGVTFLPRYLPLAVLSRLSIGPRLRAGLGFLPVAIMSAIVFPSLFSTTERPLVFEPRILISAIPVIILSYIFKKLWVAVIAGMLMYWVSGLF